MWDAIAANRRRSAVLITLMGILLTGLGTFIGLTVHPKGAIWGALAAFLVWLVLWLVARSRGDAVLLLSAGARKISRRDHPLLWNVVEEMTIAAQLPTMPDVYIINDPAPNAFATGKGPEKSAVAVTTGLLKRLDRDELQGVVGHEIGHVKNRDIRFMMVAGIMLGAIVLIGHGFLRVLFYGGVGRRRSSSGGGQGQAMILVIALLIAILAPIFARILYLACSRRREYLADATGALLTRYPEGLASALEKISSHARRAGRAKVNKVLAPMYIVNPMSALAASGLFTTHPPTEKRTRILRSMAGGADYARYEEAYRRLEGRGVLGAKTLAASHPEDIREPSEEVRGEGRGDIVDRLRQVSVLSARLDDMIALTCACGVGIHVPRGLKRDRLSCPRCGRNNAVPKGHGREATQTHRRVGARWETVRCAKCSQDVQLSPGFQGSHIRCDGCGSTIEIESPPA